MPGEPNKTEFIWLLNTKLGVSRMNIFNIFVFCMIWVVSVGVNKIIFLFFDASK